MVKAEKPQLTFVERALLVDRLLARDLEDFPESDAESVEEAQRVVVQRAGAINSLGIFPRERVVEAKHDQASGVSIPEESSLLLLKINKTKSRRAGLYRLDGGDVFSVEYFVTLDGVIQEHQVGEKDGKRIVRLLSESKPLTPDKTIKIVRLALASMRGVIKQSLVNPQA